MKSDQRIFTQLTSDIRRVVRSNFERGAQRNRHHYDLGGRQIRAEQLNTIFEELQLHQDELNQDAALFLGLWKNMLRDKGCMLISKKQLTNLTLLDVSDNGIGDAGCRELSKGNWPFLQHLLIWKNNISQKGCRHLAKANWKCFHTLSICIHEINQAYNQIGRKGYSYLAKKFITPLWQISCDQIYYSDQ